MNISALYYDYRVKSGEEYRSNINFVAAGILYIIEHYFAKQSSYFMLLLSCSNEHSCSFYNNLFYKLFAEWKTWPLQIIVQSKHVYPETKNVHQYNTILTDSYESLQNLNIHAYVKNYNTHEYYFIYLHAPKHLYEDEMQKIFEYCWKHQLINCIIMIQKDNGPVLIYTYFPYTEKYCGMVEPILVNEFNGSSLRNARLFPKKLKNFYGCPLRVSACHIPPYVYLSRDVYNVSILAGGFEGIFLLEISKKLNFSLDLVVPPIGCKGELMTKNGMFPGALKVLYEQKADISMGGLRQTKERDAFATATTQYHQFTWIILVLSEAYTLTSLEILLFPFTTLTWCLLALMGIIALSIVGLLKLKLPVYLLKHLDYVILDGLSITLGMPAINTPVFSTSRILNASWMMFSLILRTIYQALLFHFIRSHVIRNIPQSVTELVSRNCSLIVDRPTHEVLKEISIFKNIDFIVLKTSNWQTPLKYLEKTPSAQARFITAAASLIRYQYYVQINKKPHVFKVAVPNIINIKLVVYLQKHSFLIEQFNELLMMARNSGTVQAWLSKYIDRNYIRNSQQKANQVFGLKQLQMLFILLLICHLLAIFVFIAELLYKRFKRVRA